MRLVLVLFLVRSRNANNVPQENVHDALAPSTQVSVRSAESEGMIATSINGN